MREKDIIQQIGDYRVHDAVITKIMQQKQTIEVVLNSVDEESIKIVFDDAKWIKEKQVEEMILYSVLELRREEPFRHFVFVNWDESDDVCLEVATKRYDFQVMK